MPTKALGTVMVYVVLKSNVRFPPRSHVWLISCRSRLDKRSGGFPAEIFVRFVVLAFRDGAVQKDRQTSLSLINLSESQGEM